jgi:hypothetical protein
MWNFDEFVNRHSTFVIWRHVLRSFASSLFEHYLRDFSVYWIDPTLGYALVGGCAEQKKSD